MLIIEASQRPPAKAAILLVITTEATALILVLEAAV